MQTHDHDTWICIQFRQPKSMSIFECIFGETYQFPEPTMHIFFAADMMLVYLSRGGLVFFILKRYLYRQTMWIVFCARFIGIG